MTQPDESTHGQRQLAGLAMSGGLVFYLLIALGLVLAAGILWMIRFM